MSGNRNLQLTSIQRVASKGKVSSGVMKKLNQNLSKSEAKAKKSK